MSMNKTCPISNFTSEGDSVVTLIRVLLLLAELLEPRIAAEIVPIGIESE